MSKYIWNLKFISHFNEFTWGVRTHTKQLNKSHTHTTKTKGTRIEVQSRSKLKKKKKKKKKEKLQWRFLVVQFLIYVAIMVMRVVFWNGISTIPIEIKDNRERKSLFKKNNMRCFKLYLIWTNLHIVGVSVEF